MTFLFFSVQAFCVTFIFNNAIFEDADISNILTVVQSLTITVTVTFCNVFFSDGKAMSLPIRIDMDVFFWI